ncbi:hypothetical protein QA648_10930 [Rhizobium sp. CB3171]|uniref:hypothetical protein n=1 Tax=Rhizobium sp. CB3171 TaxID=3039157 RepID=UPI0024B1FCA1|nr:hypothetical protein [Rhizobium sp. CB3171]WFU00685.1 hypothetical protein QA648_10930 [Rhizobium sp. CB3171]
MAGIDVLTYVSGKQVFILTGDGIEGHHSFDSYREAMDALKKIKALKDDYKRLQATRDMAVYHEAAGEAMPDGYALFIFKIGDEVVAGIVRGPSGYLARSHDVAKLIKDAWLHSSKRSSSMASSPSSTLMPRRLK